MREMQLVMLIRLFAALYVSEGWTPTVEKGGKIGLYARARRVVVFDRALNDEQWKIL